MDKSEIESKIINIISESFFVSNSFVKLESDLTYDLNLDSLDMLDLVFQIEQEFKIVIDDKMDFKTTNTVNNVVNLIASAIEAKDNKFLKGETK